MERAAAAHFIENATQVVFGIIVRREGIHPVIGKAASRRCEAVVPPTQRVQQLSIRADRNVRRLFEPCEVSVVVRRIGYGQRPVGTPRRQHPDGKIAGSQLTVVFQRIDRVVGRTDRPNVAPPHQRLRRKRVGRQRGVAGVVNFTRRSGRQHPVDPEQPGQFEVRPVVQRIPHRIRNRFGPLPELLVIASGAGYILFRNAVGPHRAPFIMVAAEPCLGNTAETVVAGDHFRIEMTVIVDDRHLRSIPVIEFDGRIGRQHEIFSYERAHVIFRFYRSFPREPSDIPKPKVINFPEFRARARNKIQHSGKYSLFLPGVLLPVRTSDDRPQTTANRQNTTRHEQTG